MKPPESTLVSQQLALLKQEFDQLNLIIARTQNNIRVLQSQNGNVQQQAANPNAPAGQNTSASGEPSDSPGNNNPPQNSASTTNTSNASTAANTTPPLFAHPAGANIPRTQSQESLQSPHIPPKTPALDTNCESH